MKSPLLRLFLVTLPILAGVIAIGLATHYWAMSGVPISDAIYRGLSVLGVGDAHRALADFHNDLSMQWARFLGAFAVLAAAIGAVLVILRDTLARLVSRLGSQPVVVIGDHPIAAVAFEVADRVTNGGRMHLGASKFRASWQATSLPWDDQNQMPATAASHVNKARNILVAQNDDAQTLSIACAVHKAAPDACVTALVSDLAIARGAGKTASDGRLRIRTYGELAARALHRDHAPFLRAHQVGHSRIHALIIGFGDMGEAILRDLVVNCRTTKLALPRITIIDPNIQERLSALRLVAPELDQTCVITPIAASLGRNSGALEPTEAEPFTCVYVCLDSDTNSLVALAGAQAWLRQLDQVDCPLFVRLRDKAVLAIAPGNPIAFGDLHDLVRESECLSRFPDAAAQAYHLAYLANLSPEERARTHKPANKPWDNLDETYRAANRAAVAHIPAKLASAGIDAPMVTSGLPKLPEGTKLYHSDYELTALAVLEHERWNAERRLSGWRFAAIFEKDEARLLHPSLVPFEALSATVQGYDVAFVEATGRLVYCN
jgi:hypothetical protein